MLSKIDSVLVPAINAEGYWIICAVGDKKKEARLAHQIYLGNLEVMESELPQTILIRATDRALDKYWYMWY